MGLRRVVALVVFWNDPGKALLKTRLVLGESQSIPYSLALSRSFKVWWRGLAAGLPFINLLTLTHAETDLTADYYVVGQGRWFRRNARKDRYSEIGSRDCLVGSVPRS